MTTVLADETTKHPVPEDTVNHVYFSPIYLVGLISAAVFIIVAVTMIMTTIRMGERDVPELYGTDVGIGGKAKTD